MKGVSDIIAIILILLITVSLAALAYLWFTGVFEQITGIAGNQTEEGARAIATKFSIEAARGYQTESKVNIVIRNTGTVDLKLQKLATYVDNILYTGREGLVAVDLPPGDITSPPFNVTNVPNGGCGLPLRVTADTGREATLTITC